MATDCQTWQRAHILSVSSTARLEQCYFYRISCKVHLWVTYHLGIHTFYYNEAIMLSGSTDLMVWRCSVTEHDWGKAALKPRQKSLNHKLSMLAAVHIPTSAAQLSLSYLLHLLHSHPFFLTFPPSQCSLWACTRDIQPLSLHTPGAGLI